MIMRNMVHFIFRQVTQITGITKLASGISVVDDIKNMKTEPGILQ